MDTLNAEQRSLNMAKIHSKDTKPEVFLRSALHKAGFRFRKNDKRYLGTPDIFLPHYNAVIFILARTQELPAFQAAKNKY